MMNTADIIIVRIYTTEKSHLLKKILTYLKKETPIRGTSVFRAISGFGETGDHDIGLVDLALDLPLVIEFFDQPDKVFPVLDHLKTIIKPSHIIYWPAQQYV